MREAEAEWQEAGPGRRLPRPGRTDRRLGGRASPSGPAWSTEAWRDLRGTLGQIMGLTLAKEEGGAVLLSQGGDARSDFLPIVVACRFQLALTGSPFRQDQVDVPFIHPYAPLTCIQAASIGAGQGRRQELRQVCPVGSSDNRHTSAMHNVSMANALVCSFVPDRRAWQHIAR